MSDRFSFSRLGPGDDESWFRIGTLEVTTTWLVTFISIFGVIVSAFVPSLMVAMALFPQEVLHGQVWRLITWPLVNDPSRTIWTVLTIFFFWYFGTQLERNLGRIPFARFLAWLTLALSIVAVALSALLNSAQPILAGLSSIQLIVVLLFIGEHPTARFFFNIPGWVIAAVLVGIQVLAYVGALAAGQGGAGVLLLNLLIGLLVAAALARRYGMLDEVPVINSLPGGGPAAPRPTRQRRPRRQSRRQARRHGSATVTPGPWGAASSSAAGSDRARLDALLDKIHASGMDSLSKKERQELTDLSRRLRDS